MGRILLTSSQVSVLITTAIIFFCTSVLFFSGYVIQQRTLTQLRASIRPRQPRTSVGIYLPEHFKQQAASDADEVPQISTGPTEDAESQEDGVIIEVTPTESEEEPIEATSKGAAEAPVAEVSKDKIALVEELKAKAAEKAWAVENPDPLSKNRAPITAAERRRLIKEEITRLAQSDQKVYYQRRLW